jgi:hypothetical protein
LTFQNPGRNLSLSAGSTADENEEAKMTTFYDPEYIDLHHTFWYCNVCGGQNSCLDGECQYCECGGMECKRSNCSEPQHFHADHVSGEDGTFGPYSLNECPLCRVGG